MRLRRTLRYYRLKFKRLQDSPRKLAWGMALGVFVGVTPTFPLHTLIVLGLAPLFRVSLLTAFMGIWVMNPLTIAPLYYAAYKVGNLLLLRTAPFGFPHHLDFHALADLLWRGGLALQLGGLLIAIPLAVMAYFLTLWTVKRYRRAKSRSFKNRESDCVPAFPQKSSAASGPEA
jgi:uncharacterized protein